MHRSANTKVNVVGLLDLNGVWPAQQRQDAVAEFVGDAVWVQREFIEIGILDRVIGMRPADLVAVTDGDERAARENRAAGVQFRIFGIADDKIRLHQLVDTKTKAREGLIKARDG